MAGTIIPASLVTGLNSDLPGQVIAQITENVYDTPTGQYLLLPQGPRLMGRYDSDIDDGQSRALVVWNQLIRPDGSFLVIKNLPSVDLLGQRVVTRELSRKPKLRVRPGWRLGIIVNRDLILSPYQNVTGGY